MLPDAECLKIAVEILSELNIGNFSVKVRKAGLCFIYYPFISSKFNTIISIHFVMSI